MRLENHDGLIADPAELYDVAPAVAALTAVGEAFIVLDDDRAAETYVQAAGTVVEQFLVEYRDGCAGEHWRCDERVSAGVLTTLFVAYLCRDPDWRSGLAWHRVRVDQAAPSA